MDNDKDKEAQAPDTKPTLSAASTVIWVLVMLAFAGVGLIVLKNLATIIFVGRICYKRGGCNSWSSGTWAMSVDLLYHLVLLVMLVSMIGGICKARSNTANTD
jgi:hypothetical protein